MARITVESRKKRLADTAAAIEAAGVDVAYVPAGTGVMYYCGVPCGQSDRLVCLLISREGQSAFVSPSFEADRFRENKPPVEMHAWEEHESPHVLVAEIIARWGHAGGTIGVDGRLVLRDYNGLIAAMPKATFMDASGLLDRARIIKSAEEIECLRAAGQMVYKGLQTAIEMMQPGTTEKQVADAIAARIAQEGATGGAMVQSGPTASFPHAATGQRKFEAGDLVVIDSGAQVEGYCADVTRTFAVGSLPARSREIYEIVRSSQQAGIAACRSGAKAEDVDRACRDVIEKAGFGQYFTHRTGHGIGLDGHEVPYIVLGNTRRLESGMTFTVEPGIYIPGELGVRLEDDILITADGCDDMTAFATEPEKI